MDQKNNSICLLNDVDDVENFLKSLFKTSSNKIKKHFPKKLLNKSLKKGALLELPYEFSNDGLINPSYEGAAIEILAENGPFLAFNKPENIFIHPLHYNEKNNCLSFFRSIKRFDLLKINQAHYDRGLLYRLDYETSGVVVYVKDEAIYQNLREHFATVAKEKIYLCWVSGLELKEGSYVHSFSHAEAKGKRVVVGERNQYETQGELSFRVLERNLEKKQSLLEVRLKTGLRHQIRAQLAFLGAPLIGDEFYGGPKARRLYLHAHKYHIVHETKDYLFESTPQYFDGL